MTHISHLGITHSIIQSDTLQPLTVVVVSSLLVAPPGTTRRSH